MDIKTILGFGKSATSTDQKRQAMQQRIATIEGCRKLASELELLIDKLDPRSSVRRLYRDQLQEVNRLQQIIELQQDRVRVASVIKRDQSETSKALKEAEAALKTAYESWAGIERRRLDCQEEIDRLSRELANVFGEADKGVSEAEAAFRQIMSGEKQGADAEAQAFEALRKAKNHRQTCGEFWEHRIALRRDQLRTIETELTKEEARKAEAERAADEAKMMLAAIDYDLAIQHLIDASSQIRAVSSTKIKNHFITRAGDLPTLNVVSAERIVGAGFVDAQRHVSGSHVVQILANLKKPADLDLLTREAPPDDGDNAGAEADGAEADHVDQAPMEA